MDGEARMTQEARDDERGYGMLVRELRSAQGDGTDWIEDLISRAADAIEMLRKRPEPEITEARIDAAARAMFEDTYGDGDWSHREEIEEKLYRNRARVALTAALRVPVGEGEQ